MIERLEAGGWDVVDEPGPNVVHTTAQAAVRDLWKKIDIIEVGLVIEWLDSTSGEVLSAGLAERGGRKRKDAEPVSWEELDALFKTIGEQTRCHMDNNKLPALGKRQDCDSIEAEPVAYEQ